MGGVTASKNHNHIVLHYIYILVLGPMRTDTTNQFISPVSRSSAGHFALGSPVPAFSMLSDNATKTEHLLPCCRLVYEKRSVLWNVKTGTQSRRVSVGTLPSLHQSSEVCGKMDRPLFWIILYYMVTANGGNV